MNVLIINGPNLNLLGKREPHIYGHDTLDSIYANLMQFNPDYFSLDHIQSNHEGVLIDKIYQAIEYKTDWIIINPAAFTHTSIALRDALLASQIQFVEVHLSNVHKRESFRHHSFFSDIAKGVICGFGAYGYTMALQFIYQHTVTL